MAVSIRCSGFWMSTGNESLTSSRRLTAICAAISNLGNIPSLKNPPVTSTHHAPVGDADRMKAAIEQFLSLLQKSTGKHWK